MNNGQKLFRIEDYSLICILRTVFRNVWMVVACAMAKIPLSKYYKWLLPFYGICFALQIIFIVISIAIGYA